jgi:transketolase N-terminal domain/subunit
VVEMTSRVRASHVGTSLSMAHILGVLYSGVLCVDPTRPTWPDRDRVILSKGPGCAGLYAVLAERRSFSTDRLALFAAHHQLDNLVAIVDCNKMQSLGTPRDIPDLEPLTRKWRVFGWATRELNGHDVRALSEALAVLPTEPRRPTCIVANTVKGKGVSFMENELLWHYRAPDDSERPLALAELEAAE